MKECIVNKMTFCPYDTISIKLCSCCEIPDKEREKTTWYEYLCLNVPCFKKLSLDDQGEMVLKAVELFHKFMKNILCFDKLQKHEQEKVVVDFLMMEC